MSKLHRFEFAYMSGGGVVYLKNYLVAPNVSILRGTPCTVKIFEVTEDLLSFIDDSVVNYVNKYYGIGDSIALIAPCQYESDVPFGVAYNDADGLEWIKLYPQESVCKYYFDDNDKALLTVKMSGKFNYTNGKLKKIRLSPFSNSNECQFVAVDNRQHDNFIYVKVSNRHIL